MMTDSQIHQISGRLKGYYPPNIRKTWHLPDEVVEKHTAQTTWLSWQAEEPIGSQALLDLAASQLESAIS
jgi:hypothetical protein